MGITGLIRVGRRQGAYALLVIAFPMAAFADSTTTTTASPKKSQTQTSHSATSHATSSHSTSSPAKSSAAKTHVATSKTTASKTQAAHATSKHVAAHSSRGKKTAKKRGQQIIDSGRARQIQEALIREHYLTGEPTGAWDSTTQAAMQRYQADQGWQNKTTPDSRALIKLGLGPSNDHLLNPESAMTSGTLSSRAMTSSATRSAATTSAAAAPTGDPTPKGAPKPATDSNPQPTTDSNSSAVSNNQPNK